MIPFTKAHACGNDFLIVAQDVVADHHRAELTRRLCARNTGIGADGVEFFAWTGKRTGRIRLHNADGSIAEISGNGTRCVAAWMAEQIGCKAGDELEIATDAGTRVCRIEKLHDDGQYAVDVCTAMGVPTFTPHTIRLSSGEDLTGIEVSTGNPHLVFVVDSPDFRVTRKIWTVIGAEACVHPDFPNQTNVEFVYVHNEREIEIRIFERGVGPTTSSGTGTSASATAALALKGCISPLTVIAPGGAQTVAWSGPGQELYLTGPAALIARGEAW